VRRQRIAEELHPHAAPLQRLPELFQGLSAAGMLLLLQGQDARDVFFSESDDGRYTPRALLFDLEPRSAVVSSPT